MKLLVVFLVVLFGVWLWRQGRLDRLKDRADQPAPRPKPQAALPHEMVRCAVCGLHLPASEALTSPRGSFCGPEHQRQAER